MKQENMSYPGCPLQYNGRTCNKKLTDQTGDESSWYCERCQEETQPDWRYILSVQADDFSGHLWLTAFQVSCPISLILLGNPSLVSWRCELYLQGQSMYTLTHTREVRPSSLVFGHARSLNRRLSFGRLRKSSGERRGCCTICTVKICLLCLPATRLS